MIKFYDSRLRKKIEFKPLVEGKIGIYVCGPTVYDVGHLGHGRSAVAFDVIRRYLEYRGYKVKFVSNYTDVDDKMINRAKEKGISVPELADKIIPEYEEDYGALGVKVPDIQPKATENIEEMIDLIRKLEDAGYTYVLDDGVYFDVEKFSDYGKFSGQSLEDLKMGARVDVKESKKSPYDFVLWKLKKEGEPAWESPWGEGRPGWHIECSAMSRKHLGEKFDIHGGGLDLLFPHHECEVAQSEGVFGKGSFAQYWIHNGFINIDNEKMSKSLGNFFTLKEIFKKYDPQVVRFMFLQTHYRNPINFSDVLLNQARAALMRLYDFVRKVKGVVGSGPDGKSDNVTSLISDAKKSFESAMDDDFDTSGALGTLFELVKAVNILLDKGTVTQSGAKEILSFLESIDQVLGIIFPQKEQTIDSDIEALIAKREEAREAKDFDAADKIRDQLSKKGIELEDTSDGTIWKKIK